MDMQIDELEFLKKVLMERMAVSTNELEDLMTARLLSKFEGQLVAAKEKRRNKGSNEQH